MPFVNLDSVMEIKLEKPEVPILWLDSWFIWKTTDDFWKKLAKLVIEGKIIVLDTGQHAKMLERYSDHSRFNEKSKHSLSAYQTIAHPYISIDHSSFLGCQTGMAMKAYAERSEELTFNFEDLFDPLIQELTPLLDFHNQMYGDSWGTPRNFKGLSSDISIDWTKIRNEAQANRETLLDRREKELLGMHGAIKTVAERHNAIRKKNLVYYYYLKKWKKHTGNDNFGEMFDFFKSKQYQAMPYVEVHSWLISDLVTGARDPRPSDYFDIIMIAMALPFTDYMVLDRDMRGRIVDNRLSLVVPRGSYKSKLLKESELDEVLDNL